MMIDYGDRWWWWMMLDDDLFAYIIVFFCKKKCLRVTQLRTKTMGILQNNFVMVYLYKHEKNN